MHVAVLYLLVAVAFLSFSASIALSYLNLRAKTIELGLFRNSTFDLDAKYIEYASPDGLIFTVIWPIVYVANAIGLLYMLLGAFVPPRMSPVKVSPSLTPPLFLISYSLAFLSTLGWLFSYDAQILPLAMTFLFLGAFFSFSAVGISSKRIQDNLFTLEIKGNVMMWMVRILLQNPLCILATWYTVSAVLTMTDVILYHDSLSSFIAIQRGVVESLEVGSLIGLGVLLFITVVWFILQNFVWEKYCRYIFTDYPVLIFVAAGMILKLNNSYQGENNLNAVLIMASVELAIFIMAFIVRICLLVYKFKARANAESG